MSCKTQDLSVGKRNNSFLEQVSASIKVLHRKKRNQPT